MLIACCLQTDCMLIVCAWHVLGERGLPPCSCAGWNATKDHEHIDTSSWSFTADSAAGVKRELCRLVKLHSVKLSHLFNQADKNSDFVCSYGEFLSMMEGTRFGHSLSPLMSAL